MLSFCRGPEFSRFSQVTQKPKPLSVFSAPPEEVAFPPPYAPCVTHGHAVEEEYSSPSWGEGGSFSLLPQAPFLLRMRSRFGLAMGAPGGTSLGLKKPLFSI